MWRTRSTSCARRIDEGYAEERGKLRESEEDTCNAKKEIAEKGRRERLIVKKDATCGGRESRREKEIDRATHAQHERCAVQERAACNLESDAAWLEEERGSTNRAEGWNEQKRRKIGGAKGNSARATEKEQLQRVERDAGGAGEVGRRRRERIEREVAAAKEERKWGASFAWRTRSTSSSGKRERATMARQRWRRPCATSESRVTRRMSRRTWYRLPRERRGSRNCEENGTILDSYAYAQHELRTVAVNDRSERESSTWCARAGGGRDERRELEEEQARGRYSEAG